MERLQQSTDAARRFDSLVALWAASSGTAGQNAGTAHPASPPPTDETRDLRLACDEADRFDEVLLDTIREELHAGADRPPAPLVPLARIVPVQPE
jgi:hypothetical protein